MVKKRFLLLIVVLLFGFQLVGCASNGWDWGHDEGHRYGYRGYSDYPGPHDFRGFERYGGFSDNAYPY